MGWCGGRIHGIRVLTGLTLIALVSAVVILLSYSNAVGPYRLAQVRLPGTSLHLEMEEVARMAGEDGMCPVCFGIDSCNDLSSDMSLGHILIDRRPINEADAGHGQVYRVYRKGKVRFNMRVGAPEPPVLARFEEALCRKLGNSSSSNRSSSAKRCDLFDAAERVLYRSDVDSATLKNLYRYHLVSRQRIPLTSCPSWRLLSMLIRVFDFDENNALVGPEKAMLLTSLATYPDIVIQRIIMSRRFQFPTLKYFGSCGRISFIEGPLKPLKSFLNDSAAVRIDLGLASSTALQVLKVVDSFLNGEVNWFLYALDLSLDNWVVTSEGGQAFLKDLSRVMMMDRKTFGDIALVQGHHPLMMSKLTKKTKSKPAKEGHPAATSPKGEVMCDQACVDDVHSSLFNDKNSSSGSADPCSGLPRVAPHMFTVVCRDLFLGPGGLLRRESLGSLDNDFVKASSFKDDPQIFLGLLNSCASDPDLMTRYSAGLDLITLLGGEDGVDTEDDDDYDDDVDKKDKDEDDDLYYKVVDEMKAAEVLHHRDANNSTEEKDDDDDNGVAHDTLVNQEEERKIRTAGFRANVASGKLKKLLMPPAVEGGLMPRNRNRNSSSSKVRSEGNLPAVDFEDESNLLGGGGAWRDLI